MSDIFPKQTKLNCNNLHGARPSSPRDQVDIVVGSDYLVGRGVVGLVAVVVLAHVGRHLDFLIRTPVSVRQMIMAMKNWPEIAALRRIWLAYGVQALAEVLGAHIIIPGVIYFRR